MFSGTQLCPNCAQPASAVSRPAHITTTSSGAGALRTEGCRSGANYLDTVQLYFHIHGEEVLALRRPISLRTAGPSTGPEKMPCCCSLRCRLCSHFRGYRPMQPPESLCVFHIARVQIGACLNAPGLRAWLRDALEQAS